MTSKTWQVSITDPALYERVGLLTGSLEDSVRNALYALRVPSAGKCTVTNGSEP